MLLTALLVVAASPGAIAQIADPRCEYITNPTCIDSAAPRLSWTTTSSTPSWMQAGYRILVASDPQKLQKGEGDLWDTGEVKSDASIQISYGGKQLQSRERCFWKVRVRGVDGLLSGWSRPQEWDMGLLTPADWSASEWIGGISTSSPAPAPYLRTEFETHGKVKRATLFA